MRILLTGANGFLGRHLTEALLLEPNFKLTLGLRSASNFKKCNIFEVVNIDAKMNPEVAEILIKLLGDVSFLVQVRDNGSN